MGMFDIIIVKDKLPWTDEMWAEGLPNAIVDFQSKDLVNCLAVYKIENGKLLLQKFTEEMWVEPGINNKDGLDFGHLERKGEYWEDTNYHGVLHFYDYNPANKPGNDCWVEFAATFTKGQLNGIEVTKFEKVDNTERLKNCKELEAHIERENKRWVNRYFLRTNLVCWFRRRVWYEFWCGVGQFSEKMRWLW
jgi:hypothetical protein